MIYFTDKKTDTRKQSYLSKVSVHELMGAVNFSSVGVNWYVFLFPYYLTLICSWLCLCIRHNIENEGYYRKVIKVIKPKSQPFDACELINYNTFDINTPGCMSETKV